MSRWSLTILVFVAVTGCKQPKGVQVDGRELIPADATMAFGFEVGPVRASPIGSILYTMMQSDADMRGMVEAVRGCEIDLDKLRGVMAIDPNNEGHFFAVIEGPKIGDTDTVRCFEKGFAKATGGKDGLLRFKTRGDVQTLAQEDGGQLIILNEGAIAVVDGGWEERVFAAIEKPESRNTTSALAKVVATIDPSSDTWFAIVFGDADRASFGDLEGGDGIMAVSGVADLAQGMNISATIEGRDAASAKQLEGSLRNTLEQMKPELADLGLPANLLDTAKLSSAEARVTATIEIGADALPGVTAVVAALAAG